MIHVNKTFPACSVAAVGFVCSHRFHRHIDLCGMFERPLCRKIVYSLSTASFSAVMSPVQALFERERLQCWVSVCYKVLLGYKEGVFIVSGYAYVIG